MDLPDSTTRAEIFSIHLRKRELSPLDFDIQALSALTDGFSGAEIEQVIVASLYLAREQRMHLNTTHIRDEIVQTQPLSRVMTEKVNRLRAWAKGRTVSAN